MEEAFDTGEYEPVYNLRVADYHTYFVGDAHWGFAPWAHNTYMEPSQLRKWIDARVRTDFTVPVPVGDEIAILQQLRNATRSDTRAVYGKLVVSGKAYQPSSTGGTVDGWSPVVDQAARKELIDSMGVNKTNYTHMEVAAALILRELKIQQLSNPPVQNAVLYGTLKPCDSGPQGGCHRNLTKMLEEGVTLRVIWPDLGNATKDYGDRDPNPGEPYTLKIPVYATTYVGGGATPPLRGSQIGWINEPHSGG